MTKTKFYHKLEAKLPSMEGKVIAITGTTSGTGFVAAWTAAKHGAEVILLNRESPRVASSLAKLEKIVPEGKYVPIECDLLDFASVRKAVAEMKEKYTKIYCLALNAGIMATPDVATVDGYDTQMQTNHTSHFLLCAELYPLIEAAAEEFGDARIVTHSSIGRFHTVNSKLERKYFEKNGGNLGGNSVGLMAGACYHRYFQTKLANSVFTYALHEKLAAKNSKVRSISCHTGGAVTNLGDTLVKNLSCFKSLLLQVLGPIMMQSAEDGTAGLARGMMDPEAKSGILYGPKGVAVKGPAVENLPEPFEIEPEAMKMLWETSEEAIGAKFEV